MLKIESNDRILLIPDQIISIDHDDNDGNTRIIHFNNIFAFIDSDRSIFNQVADVMRKKHSVVEIDDGVMYDVSFFRSVELIGNEIVIRFESSGSNVIGSKIHFKTRECAVDAINNIHSKF